MEDMHITLLHDNSDTYIYGFIISKSNINWENEIEDVINNKDFQEKFYDKDGVPEWTVEDVLEFLSHRFEFEYQTYNVWTDTAYI